MILIVDNRYATNKKPGNNQNKDLVNENVRFPEVLLIGPNGEQLGTMSSREAQFKANEYDLDLLCVAPAAKPPVCKIINYSKYRFEQQKKAKEAKKKQHTVEIKEVQLTPQIGVRFRGRQMTHIEVGQEVMDKFIALLSDYANIEKPSAMEGRWMYAILAPKKK